MRDAIRDYSGRVLGYIDTLQNGDKMIRDQSGRLLGKYDKASNTTRDASGRLLYFGDQVQMLIGRK